jgi:hypothetical protein
MAETPVKTNGILDLKFVALAREIAMGIRDLPEILESQRIDDAEWDQIKRNDRFITLLNSEVESWNSAVNSNERVKLKSAVLIEEWLPEANARLHDSRETLDAKTKTATLIARLAGMGLTGANIGEDGASKFSVTINLGGGAQFQKDVTPQSNRVIDVTPNPE